ncbi:hypothetical protein NXS19_001016 [Fusarium pseudograminearum]|nr:hypothetical protein NXS19_001016 [Fusarium pseudograminearum]
MGMLVDGRTWMLWEDGETLRVQRLEEESDDGKCQYQYSIIFLMTAELKFCKEQVRKVVALKRDVDPGYWCSPGPGPGLVRGLHYRRQPGHWDPDRQCSTTQCIIRSETPIKCRVARVKGTTRTVS